MFWRAFPTPPGFSRGWILPVQDLHGGLCVDVDSLLLPIWCSFHGFRDHDLRLGGAKFFRKFQKMGGSKGGFLHTNDTSKKLGFWFLSTDQSDERISIFLISIKKLDLRKLDPQTYSPKWWKFSWWFSSHGIPIRKKSPNNNKSQVKQFEGSQVPRIGWLKKTCPTPPSDAGSSHDTFLSSLLVHQAQIGVLSRFLRRRMAAVEAGYEKIDEDIPESLT